MLEGGKTTLLRRLEEEIPAKWLREVERIFDEGRIDLAAVDSQEPSVGASGNEQILAAIDPLPLLTRSVGKS